MRTMTQIIATNTGLSFFVCDVSQNVRIIP